MRRILAVVVLISICGVAAAPDSLSDMPRYASDNSLLRPDGYREWIYLSSGLGMNYSANPGDHEMFTNVFVPRWAYKEFLESGKWPDKTMKDRSTRDIRQVSV